jgi:hypothetical protein
LPHIRKVSLRFTLFSDSVRIPSDHSFMLKMQRLILR